MLLIKCRDCWLSVGVNARRNGTAFTAPSSGTIVSEHPTKKCAPTGPACRCRGATITKPAGPACAMRAGRRTTRPDRPVTLTLTNVPWANRPAPPSRRSTASTRTAASGKNQLYQPVDEQLSLTQNCATIKQPIIFQKNFQIIFSERQGYTCVERARYTL